MRLKSVFSFLAVFLVGVGLGYGVWGDGFLGGGGLQSPLGGELVEAAKPLAKYSFEKLREKRFEPMGLEFVESIATESAYTSWLFRFETEEGWVSGMANVPEECGVVGDSTSEESRPTSQEEFAAGCPVIIMLRGYVDKEEYGTGVGTRKAAAVLARSGYVTLAPDFLGYGTSDPESEDIFQARFEKVAGVLQLLASVGESEPLIGLWGHSNGGQIALSVLAITGRDIPTTLWAPVAKPFPYSILYYSDELPDRGKYLRKKLAEFEELYDVERFSTASYLSWIEGPIQVHQGTADEAVPRAWSDELVGKLDELGKEAEYFVYPGADHNLRPAWDLVVRRDLEFFGRYLK